MPKAEKKNRRQRDERLKCEVCKRIFPTLRETRDHRKVHKQKSDSRCNMCDNFFKSKVDLEAHVKSCKKETSSEHIDKAASEKVKQFCKDLTDKASISTTGIRQMAQQAGLKVDSTGFVSNANLDEETRKNLDNLYRKRYLESLKRSA